LKGDPKVSLHKLNRPNLSMDVLVKIQISKERKLKNMGRI
jgi:hypothetical protein